MFTDAGIRCGKEALYEECGVAGYKGNEYERSCK